MSPPPDPADRQFARFQRLLGGATLLMVGLSWPLWIDGEAFPQVPFVAGWPVPRPGQAWARFLILVGALGAVTSGQGGRWAWGISLAVLVELVLGDQNRLQPWVQQYLIIGLAVVGFGHHALRFARWSLIVLYAASALSKFDAPFVDELGATFVRTLGHPFGLATERWSPSIQAAAALALPAGELAVAVLLAIPRLRAWGLAGSIAQHLATIAILGPWGLDHSTIVLVWNAAFLVENCVLFGPDPTPRPEPPGWGLAAGLLVVTLAGLERWGWIDSWPSHALYASHAERTMLAWPTAQASALPPAIRRWLGPPDDEERCRLDLTGWSRAARGVPVYPQNRVACGIAEALIDRYGDPSGPPARVTAWGRGGIARLPPRARSEFGSLAALRRRGDRCWINAHPAPGFGR